MTSFKFEWYHNLHWSKTMCGSNRNKAGGKYVQLSLLICTWKIVF